MPRVTTSMAHRRPDERGKPRNPAEERVLIVPVKINGCPVNGLVDTGASISMMSRSLKDRLGIGWAKPTKTRIEAIGGEMPHDGSVISILEIAGCTREVEMIVT